ncbi:MAG: hypothetical protein V1659_01805 [Candidatus Woesearchaeota archaeon]
MVYIDKLEFNKDLGKYIAQRQKIDGDDIMKDLASQRKNREEPEQPNIEDTDVGVRYSKPFWDKIFGFLRKEEKMASEPEEFEDIEELEEEAKEIKEREEIIEEEKELIEEEKEGLLQKLRYLINFKKKDAEEEEFEGGEETPGLDPEIIELIKISHRWIEELPPLKKTLFKESDDFKRYTEILKKYKLIKSE